MEIFVWLNQILCAVWGGHDDESFVFDTIIYTHVFADGHKDEVATERQHSIVYSWRCAHCGRVREYER